MSEPHTDVLVLVDEYGNAALRAGASNSGYVIDSMSSTDWARMQTLRRRLRAEIERLRAALEGCVHQYAFVCAGMLHSGGMSALEDAMEALGLSDPCPAPEHLVCDEPGCGKGVVCGWPSSTGSRHTCHQHRKEKAGG